MCSTCLPRVETQAARCLRHCFMALSVSCWSILSHSLLWFLQKHHNYVTAQRIFNRFCYNQITISWHIHLQIFSESFMKYVPKMWEIYGKTNASLFSEHGVDCCDITLCTTKRTLTLTLNVIEQQQAYKRLFPWSSTRSFHTWVLAQQAHMHCMVNVLPPDAL